jgi:uncharacterized protein YndB with AHSA1/START domain/DNA-binding transcriptional ArsR family regulator
MEQVAAALGEPARWRIVELLAERPRTVGELATLTGLRQPQTTKHLQTLARAGLVAVFPLGQRRVYAVEGPALESFTRRLQELVETTTAHAGDRDVIARYHAAIQAESALADRSRWADGRTFTFDRVLPASREVVWQHWVDPELLATWWAPPSLRVTDCALVPRRGGRVVLEYEDGDGQAYRSEGRVRAATKPQRLEFDLSVLDDAGAVSFTAHYAVSLEEVAESTGLHVQVGITDTTVEAVPAIAGIETGWDQVLDNLSRVLGTTRRTPTTSHPARTTRKEPPS